MNQSTKQKNGKPPPYLSPLGAWALAFGCSVGWGAFVMPGTTFLPIAGPVGTALGIGVGALVMLILGANYHYLMNRFPDGGGTYTYTKRCFGYDHGFLSAWFLILTYMAIIWANATALPLIARTLLGGVFQFGFHYEIAGFHIYMGEILLAVGVAADRGAVLPAQKPLPEGADRRGAILLLAAWSVCFVAPWAPSAAGALRARPSRRTTAPWAARSPSSRWRPGPSWALSRSPIRRRRRSSR